MNDKIEFRVGGKYENVKGVYEVISIDTKQKNMIIRWENGEEIDTSLELQERIIKNMQFRKMLAEKQQTTSKPTYKIPGKYGTNFVGLDESVFKDNVVGTTWRSREGLGGAVSKLLFSKDYTFNSWAVYRMPEIQWADIKHRREEQANRQAKFYAHISRSELKYGFYIERSRYSKEPNLDWEAFLSWLGNDQNEQWLKDTCMSKQLKVILYEWSETDGELSESQIDINNGNWVLKTNNTELNTIIPYLQKLPEKKWIELYIVDSLEKDQAIDKQNQIAGVIADLFEVLMPLYEAAIKHLK